MSTNLSQNYFKDFQNLIEIQSIEALIAAQNKILEGEKQRETFLLRQKTQKQTRLKELELDLKGLQKLLEEKEKSHAQNQARINRIKENLLAVTENIQLLNLETEQKSLTLLDQEEENIIYQLMLKIDENETEQKELIHFFPGFEKTILEIKAEIEVIQIKVDVEISGLKIRVANLKEITEPKLIQAYQSTRKRYPEGNALCFTLQAKCLECRFAIPRQTESQLEHGALIEYCPGCSRLLTPISCKY